MPRRKTKKTVTTKSVVRIPPVLPRLAGTNDRMTLEVVHRLGATLSRITYDALLSAKKPSRTLSDFHKRIVDELIEKIRVLLLNEWLDVKAKYDGK